MVNLWLTINSFAMVLVFCTKKIIALPITNLFGLHKNNYWAESPCTCLRTFYLLPRKDNPLTPSGYIRGLSGTPEKIRGLSGTPEKIRGLSFRKETPVSFQR